MSTTLKVEGEWSTSETNEKSVTKQLIVPAMDVVVSPGTGVCVKAQVFKGELTLYLNK